MIKEIKRVIKESEIMKCAVIITLLVFLLTQTGRTTPSGRRRTRMGGKSSRSAWAMSTSPSKLALPFTFTLLAFYTTISLLFFFFARLTEAIRDHRRPRSARWWTCRRVPTRRACASSTT